MTDITAAAAIPATPAAEPGIPWLGLSAVLMGTFISTLNGRLSSFGIADIRGAVHAGFDEGAWITTAQTVAQMLIAPFAVWAGSVFGPRRVLLAAALAFASISLVLPFSPDLPTLLVLQFVGGLASGCFIPLTLSFVLRRLPMPLWAYGIALYALNLELSLNISASLEGWFVDNVSWRWIFWQNVPLALTMAACLHWGLGKEPAAPQRIQPDFFGLASCGIGLALIYAALDQGNRLDWQSSGLVWGLMIGGALIFATFLVHELNTPAPWINLKVALAPPLPFLLVLIAILRLTILSTAFLIPQYLGTVRGFRALQVGGTLIWIALPQLVICPLAGFMMRRSDPRINAALGMILVCCACLMAAHGLTPRWGSDEFLPTQLLQAVGQSLALSGIVFLGVLHLKPENALTFGAMLQAARLMGGEIGTAAISTFVRVREQRASNLIGQHLQKGDTLLTQRLAAYARVAAARAPHAGSPTARAGGLLAGVVRSAATTEGVIDGFMAVAAVTILALLVLVIVKPPPASPAIFRPRLALARAATP